MDSMSDLLNGNENCHQEFLRKDRILSTGFENVSHIFSEVSREYIVVASQNSVCVFSTKTLNIIWSFQIENAVGSVAISEDSCLLFIAEIHGLIHMYHIPTKSNLWRVMCPAEDTSFATLRAIIPSLKSSGYLSVFIIFTNWVIFEISNIFIPNLYKAIKNGNFVNTFHEVVIKKLDLGKSYPEYNIIHIFPVYLKKASLGILYKPMELPSPTGKPSEVDSSSISDSSCDFSKDICDVTLMSYTFSDNTFLNDQILTAQDISSQPDAISLEDCCFFTNPNLLNASKIVHTRDENFLIALNNNAIHILNAEKGIHCSTLASEYPIEDFVLNEDVSDNGESLDHKIGLKCRTVSEKSLFVFEIRTLSSFTLLYQVNLSSFMQLIRCVPDQNFWSIVSGDILPRNSNESQINNLLVSFFLPPSSDAVLSSLIKEGKMHEAEELARKQNLSIELIHQTIVKNILSEFSKDESGTLPPEKVKDMWNTINKSLMTIKDLSFIKSCASYLLPDIDQEKKLLSCIQKWMVNMDQSEDAFEMLHQVNQLMKRINTYQTIAAFDSCLNLKSFLLQDMLSFMISELKQGNPSAAFVIWQRHKDGFNVLLNIDNIKSILEAIPSTTPSKILIPFMDEDFLPAVFLRCPESIATIAAWIKSTVYDFEILEEALWPENGLELLKVTLSKVNDLFSQNNESKISVSTAIACASEYRKPHCVGVLTEFHKYVIWIKVLKKDFDCTVQLSDFKESKNVIFSVIDGVNVACLSKAIDKFARPFAIELGLDLDCCLEEYLMKFVQKIGSTWLSKKDDLVEEKLVTIINNIVSSACWTNATLRLLAKVAVPWSQRVQELVQEGLTRDCTRKLEFLLQSKLVGFKEIVEKYEMRNEFFNEKFASIFVNHIFKENRQSAIEDAEKVLSSIGESVKKPDVYFKYLQFSLKCNKIDDIVHCFSEISEEYGIKCASRLLKYIVMILDDFIVKDNEELVSNAQYIGIYLVKYLKKAKQPVDDNLLIQLKSLEKLQEEFGLSLTLSELLSDSNSETIIQTAIQKFITECESSGKSSKLPLGVLQVYRLGHILLIKREKVLGFLITECLKEKKYEFVLMLCNEIIDSYQSGDAAETLIQVVKHFYKNFMSLTSTNFSIMVNTIHHLTGAAMTYLSEGSLLDNLPILQLTMFVSSIKEITGKWSLTADTQDPYKTWKFSPLFQDQGFQLNFDSVMKFLIAVFKLPDLSSCRNSREVENFFISARDLLTHMNDSEHTIAVLHTMYFVHIVTLHHTRIKKSLSTGDESNESIQDSEFVQFFSGLRPIINGSVNSVIQHAVSQRKVDLNFALYMLYLVPREVQYVLLNTLLKWSSRDLKILPYVARIGMELAQAQQETECYSTFENVFKRALFLTSHPTKSVSTELLLNPSPPPEHCSTLVKNLLSSEKLDLSAVISCCRAFHLSLESVLMAYLRELLVRAERKSFLSGNLENHVVPALTEAETIISLIKNEEELFINLVDFSSQISPYSYEILMFIKVQLQALSANIHTCNPNTFELEIRLLKFLVSYKRISSPNEFEKERCLFSNTENSILPAISSTRLPFLYVLEKNLTKVVNPEFRENTLKIWLEVASLLKISADHMIIITVRNVVTRYLELLSSKHFVSNADDPIIQTIEDMILEISSEEKLIFTANWVAMTMPPGKNRVQFAYTAVKCAKKWFAKDPFNENVKKVEAIHRKFSIESILYKYNLKDSQLLNLIQYPVQLIECLLENFLLSDESYKVCKTAVEVAEIAGIKLIDIIFKYIFNWLNVSPANHMDETFLESVKKPNIDKNYDLDCENLKRIIHLLTSIPASLCSDLQKEMMKIFGSMEKAQQYRLIFCLVSAFGYVFVSEILQCDAKTLEESMVPMLCSMELKSLGFPYSTKLFKKCDKTELVGKILSTKINCPRAVRFCIRLCMEFHVWNAQLWEVILKRFSDKPSDFAVQDILESVQGYLVHMWNNTNFIAAWETAIDYIFKTSYDDDFQFLRTLYKSLLRCPCVHQLNVHRLIAEITAKCNFIEKSIQSEDICTLISILKVYAEKKYIG